MLSRQGLVNALQEENILQPYPRVIDAIFDTYWNELDLDVEPLIDAFVQVWNADPNSDPIPTTRPDGKPGLILQRGENLLPPYPKLLSLTALILYLSGYPLDLAQVQLNVLPVYRLMFPMYNFGDIEQYARLIEAFLGDADPQMSKADWAELLDPYPNLEQYSLNDMYVLREYNQSTNVVAEGWESLLQLQEYINQRNQGKPQIPFWIAAPYHINPNQGYVPAIFTPNRTLIAPKQDDFNDYARYLNRVVEEYGPYDFGLFGYYKGLTAPRLNRNCVWEIYRNNSSGLGPTYYRKPLPDEIPAYIATYGRNALVLKRTRLMLQSGINMPRLVQLTKTILNMLGYGGDEIVAIIVDGVLQEQSTPTLTSIATRNMREGIRTGAFVNTERLEEEALAPKEVLERIDFSPT